MAGAGDLLADLAHAEYRRRMGKSMRSEVTVDSTRPIIDKLMSLSRRWRRQVAKSGQEKDWEIVCDLHTFSFDGWRVARFLKQVKDGKVPDHD